MVAVETHPLVEALTVSNITSTRKVNAAKPIRRGHMRTKAALPAKRWKRNVSEA